MSNRRSLLIVLGATALSQRTLFAQSKQPLLIGYLSAGSRESGKHLLVAFKEGLAALGWKEGLQVVIEERWGDSRRELLSVLAKELAMNSPAVIVASALPAAVAAAKAAPRTPVVMAAAGDPVAARVAASLARPGGMVTGLTNVNVVSQKDPELLLAVAPKLRRVGFLANPVALDYRSQMDAVQRSVAQQSVETRFAEAAKPEEIDGALARLANEGAQALVVMPSTLFRTEQRRIVKFVFARRWPAISPDRELTEAGALLSYGSDLAVNHRRAAYYVDRILKGAKPGDLPIEQPTKFELVVNMKTAKALGITIPQSVLVQADKVIE